jgi:predicted metal-binding membrane protein
VGGLGAPTTLHRGIEAALRRDRLVVALSLGGVVVLAWLYLWRQAAAMHAGNGGTLAMSMPAMPAMDPAALALTFVMWVVMMAGMMLPSAAPTVLLYGAMVRKHAERGTVLPAVWVFVSGYLLVWTGFSLAAVLLQIALEHAALLTPRMASGSNLLNGVLLVGAGVYQLTPLKDLCLSNCRNPVQFFMTHWRPGTAGALRMGISQGAYCVGCCWMLMLLLFAVGAMNLAWVALNVAFVFLEKLLPAGRLTSRLAGAALIVVGLTILALAA